MGRALSGLLALLCLFALGYSQDLTQKNHEGLFMERGDYQTHQLFFKKLPAPNILLLASKNLPSFHKVIGLLDDQLEEADQVLSAQNFKTDELSAIQFSRTEGQAALVLLPENPDEVSKLVGQIVPAARSLDADFAFSGVSYINYELDEASKVIQNTLFPLTFFLCFLGLLITFRNFSLSLLIFVPSLLVTGLSLALIKLTLTHLDMVTSTIPLMSFILNLTMGLHLCLTRMESKSFKEVLKEKRRPILLMVATTAIGFGSLAFSEIPVIRSFALLSAALILLTHITHVLIVAPFYDAIYPRNYKLPQRCLKLTSLIYHWIKSIKIFSIFAAILFAFGIYLATKIEIHTQAANYFPIKSVITKGQEFIHQNFLGNPNLEVLLDVGELTYEKAVGLNQIERILQKEINGQIISSGTMLREVNRIYTKEDVFPPNPFAWSALQGQLPEKLRSGLTNDRYYRLSILGPLLPARDYQEMLESVQSILKKHSYPFEFGGLYYTLIKSQHNLIRTLAISFSTSLIIMALIAFLFYPIPKVFAAFTFVNIIPLGLSLIAFKLIGLSFNVATIMTFSLSLGMIVDGSFHIIHSRLQKEKTPRLLASTLAPIFISSTILGLSFLAFAPIGFLPIREFGLALSINTFIGLFFDLAVLPKILSSVLD